MAITVNMPDGSVRQFADGTSYEDIRAQLANLKSTPAPGRSADSEEIGWGDAALQGIMNLPKSAYENGKALVDMVANYDQTGEALAGLAKGTALKGWRHLTGNGDGPKYPEEVYPDAVGQYFKDRYGSANGIKNTLAKDPFGMATDLSTLFTGGAGLTKGLAYGASKAGTKVGADLAKVLRPVGDAATRAAEITDPVQVAMKGLYYGTKYAYGRGMDPAKKLYQSALGPTMAFGKHPKYSDAEIKAMVDMGLGARIPVTSGGLEKAALLRGQLGKELQAEIEAAEAAGKTVDPEEIVRRALNSDTRRKVELTDYSPEKKDVASFDKRLMGFLDEYPMGGKARPTDIQERKVALNEKLAPTLQNSTKKNRKASHVEADNALRHEMMVALEEQAPAVRNINQAIGTIKDLEPEILRASTRGANKGVIDILKGGAAGAASGNPALGVATAVGAPFLASPGIKSRMAFGLDYLGKNGNKLRPAFAALNADAQVPQIAKWYMDPRDGYGEDPEVRGLLELMKRKSK